jgi:Protein of unknown function (DUF992)
MQTAKEDAMRWWMMVVLPVCAGFGTMPGSRLPTEIGVLSCTLGRAVDTPASDTASGASETREMLCAFSPVKNGPEEAYAGVLKSMNATGPLPENLTVLWVVSALAGTRPSPGLLQQSYSADSATPRGQTPLLVGDQNGEITLRTMSDKEEGSAAKEKQSVAPFAITALELKLKASTS